MVAIIIKQRMFARQLGMRPIILFDAAAGREIGFQYRHLAILVEVRLRIGNRFRQILTESRKVHLEAALGGRDNHPVGGREPVNKRTAGRSTVDDNNRSLHRESANRPAPHPSNLVLAG